MRGSTRVWLTVAAKMTAAVNGRKLTPVRSGVKCRSFWMKNVRNRNSEKTPEPASAVAA